MKQLLLITTILLAQNAFSAPHPGGVNKAKPTLGVYNSPQGFQIQTAGTDWIQAAPPKNTRYIATVFRSPNKKNDMHATMTVRVDQLNSPMALNAYVKRWTQEYPKFGFDVKGTKKFSLNGNDGYFVDLVNPVKQRQLRQVIFMKDKKAVLLTCRDHINNFKSSIVECNKFIRSFKWQQAANKAPASAKPAKKI